MAKDTFYFSHDYSARQDEKIKNLLRKHGMIGYGIFWSIIEDLYNNANALRTDYEGIGYDLRVDKKIAESVVTDFDLFVFNDGFFGSLSVQRRIEERDKKSQKARESAFRKWEIVRTQSERKANAQKSHAIKERKGKEKKESKYTLEFEAIWKQYERKGSKIKAYKNYLNIAEEIKLLLPERIKTYILNKPEFKYRKDLENYFTNETYESQESLELINGNNDNASEYTEAEIARAERIKRKYS